MGGIDKFVEVPKVSVSVARDEGRRAVQAVRYLQDFGWQARVHRQQGCFGAYEHVDGCRVHGGCGIAAKTTASTAQACAGKAGRGKGEADR